MENIKVMEKKIEDYLHLYLGCKMTYSSHHEPQDATYVLTAKKVDDAIYFADQPALRPLSDMTEKDIYKIVSIMLGKEVDYLKIDRVETDFIVAQYKDEESIFPQYDRVQMEIHISNIGNPFRID